MNLDLRPYIALWGVLALLVLGLFIRRKMVAAKEDDNIHVMSAGSPELQAAIATKLDFIDKWGKILTVALLLVGLAIGAAYVYANFTGRPSMGE